MMALSGGERISKSFSSSDKTPDRDRQTDGQTDMWTPCDSRYRTMQITVIGKSS